jgi:hypothetical protein
VKAVFASIDPLVISIKRVIAGTLSQPTWSTRSRFRSSGCSLGRCPSLRGRRARDSDQAGARWDVVPAYVVDALAIPIKQVIAGTLSQPTWSMRSRIRSRREPAGTTSGAPRKRSAVSSKRWRLRFIRSAEVGQITGTRKVGIYAFAPLPPPPSTQIEGEERAFGLGRMTTDIDSANQPSPRELAQARLNTPRWRY